MDRKETTRWLSNLLVDCRLSSRQGKYYASEVSLDYGTKDVRRVDFMQFEPVGVTAVSAIEKGIFTCYEVKSCREDVYSGNGLNFIGEKNYIVTTMETYKKILEDIRSGKFYQHLQEFFPDSNPGVGFIVPCPFMRELGEEFESPTPIDEDVSWEMKVIYNCHQGLRKKSMTELLFYMLRAGH